MALPSDSSERERNSLVQNSFRDKESDNAVEADDIASEGLLQQLLHHMNPKQCMTSQCLEKDDPMSPVACRVPLFTDELVVKEVAPSILKDLQNEGKLRAVALQKLYRMTDRERKHNRIPFICTTQFDTIGAIVPCLSPDASMADRRQALLLINNLCVPMENKAVILLGEPFAVLMPALLLIIRQRLPESYLAAVCLFNLSFLPDGRSLLLEYVPPECNMEGKHEYRHYAPLENPISLLRTMELVLKDFVPYVMSSQSTTTRRGATKATAQQVHSVEGEAVRWSMGLFRNLSKSPEAAVVIANETNIPALAVQCLHGSAHKDLSLWHRDSLQDACLMLLVHLAQFDECVDALCTKDTLQVLQQLQGRGGIHETRAQVLLRRLQNHDHKDALRHDEKKEYSC